MRKKVPRRFSTLLLLLKPTDKKDMPILLRALSVSLVKESPKSPKMTILLPYTNICKKRKRHVKNLLYATRLQLNIISPFSLIPLKNIVKFP